MKRIKCCYGADMDAVAGWLGSYGGEDSGNDISRGVYAGTIGTERLLKLFAKHDIRTTWFIPGHSIETFPEQCKMIHDAGHEIGLHGYSHENPMKMTLEQQRAILEKCYDLIVDLTGSPPRGSVAPWWETSKEGAELLLEFGLEYDHSMMYHDCQAHYLRTGDDWTKIDYTKEAAEWMKPLTYGEVTGMVEIPANWYLDDLPPMMFIKKMQNSHGWTSVREVEQLWKDHFTYFMQEHDDFIFPMTVHPDVSGRPHVLLMHDRLIEWINSHRSAECEIEWMTYAEVCDDFKQRNKPPENARIPVSPATVLARESKRRNHVTKS